MLVALGIAAESPQRARFFRAREDLQRKARPPIFLRGERPDVYFIKNYTYIYIVCICLYYYLCSLNLNYSNDTYNIARWKCENV